MTTSNRQEKVDLGSFEGAPVLSTTIKIKKAGDGLSKAMDVDPVLLHTGQKVYVVLETEVGPIAFPPIKDTEGVARVHDLIAQRATFIDKQAVAAALDAQERRIEEAQGIQRLPIDGDGDGPEEGEEPVALGSAIDEALATADASEEGDDGEA